MFSKMIYLSSPKRHTGWHASYFNADVFCQNKHPILPDHNHNLSYQKSGENKRKQASSLTVPYRQDLRPFASHRIEKREVNLSPPASSRVLISA